MVDVERLYEGGADEFYRTESQLSSRRLVDFEADGRRYLVRFLEHALKDDVAPFSAVRNEVVDMILHGANRNCSSPWKSSWSSRRGPMETWKNSTEKLLLVVHLL